MSLSDNGRFIVSGSSDNIVRVWVVLNKAQEAVLTGHQDSVWSVCMSGNGKLIASGSLDETVRIWNVVNKTQEAI